MKALQYSSVNIPKLQKDKPDALGTELQEHLNLVDSVVHFVPTLVKQNVSIAERSSCIKVHF